MDNSQNSVNENSTQNEKKEIPWLKIFLITIAVLLVLNGIKSVIGKHSSKSVSQSGTQSEDSKGVFGSKADKVKNTIDVPAIKDTEITIDGITLSETVASNAEFITYAGSLTDEKPEDTYEFVVPREGRYRFDFSGIVSPGKVRFMIFDSLEKRITDKYCATGDGVTETDLTAGETYKLVVAMNNRACDYTMTIGQQKEELDITAFTSVKDSVEFIDQKNVYSYTVPVDGRLRLQVDDLQGSAKVRLLMWDSLEQNVLDTYCRSGEGKVLKNLTAGDTYQIQVRQDSELSSYTLKVFGAKPDVDISECNVVKDSIEFVDQRNVYQFTVPEDGRYRFELDGVKSGFRPCIRIYDSNDQNIAEQYCRNNEGVTVKDWKAGEQYEVQVVQYEDVGSYTLKIGKQKEAVTVEASTMVNDSIQYTDQRNVYLLEGEEGKSYQITIKNMSADQEVSLCAFDSLGYEIASDNYANANDSITINTLDSDQEINIQVRQSSGLGNYSIVIQKQ